MILNTQQLRRELTPLLGRHFFAPNPRRVVFLVIAYAASIVHLIITHSTLAGQASQLLWACSLFATANVMTFFFFYMHEALHGSVFRSRWATSLSAFLGGMPFLCSPYVWRVWHNHHHRHTAKPEDTDRAPHPDIDDYALTITRVHDFGKRLWYFRLFAYVVPFIVISGHHLLMLIQTVLGYGPLTMNKRRAVLETAAIYAVFFLPLFVFGFRTSILGLYLPLMVAHLICNVYILSNHFDNPLNDENYPLVNSTSVYLLSRLPVTHMGFGRHVEHHIYPHVSHDKLAEISRHLRRLFPEQFRERQLLSVLHSVFSRSKSEAFVGGNSRHA